MSHYVGRRAWWLPLPAVGLIALVLGSSLGTLALQSLGLVPLVGRPALTLAGYRSVEADLVRGALLSLSIAASATLIALVVGLLTALACMGRGGRLLRLVSWATIPVPHLVGAAAVGLLLADSGVLARILGLDAIAWPDLVAGRWWVAVVLEYAWKESAFVALVVAVAMATRVAQYDETAALLGAGRVQRLRHVTLPLATPALVGAGTLSFIYALGSYEVAWLLGRSFPEPLPVLAYRLFTSTDLASRPEAAAVAVVTVFTSLAVGGLGLAALKRVRVMP